MIGEETLKKPGLLPETLWDIEHYKEAGLYFYLEATQDILPNGRVNVENHGEMIMLGSYSYLGLIGHPQINAAAISNDAPALMIACGLALRSFD